MRRSIIARMRNVLRAIRLGEDRVRQVLHLHGSATSRERDAQRFWSRPPQQKDSFWWHMRGASAYSDEQWLSIGRRHVELYRRLAGPGPAPQRVAEWGAGGGANAVAFAKGASDFWGIDVSAPSLDECARQVSAFAPEARFHPAKIEIPSPEGVLQQIPRNLDLLVSFYVFEVFPSQDYGARVLRIAHQLLKPDAHAFIQVKYETDAWQTRSRKWAYTRGAANMTTYRIDAFWTMAASCGFEPISITLVPKPAEVPDERYAYFLLRRK